MSESSFRDPKPVAWDFRAAGHGWGTDTWERLELIEEFKLEVIDGKLMFDDTMRLLLMGLLAFPSEIAPNIISECAC